MKITINNSNLYLIDYLDLIWIFFYLSVFDHPLIEIYTDFKLLLILQKFFSSIFINVDEKFKKNTSS